MSMQTEWYGVRLILEALHPEDADGERLFEERIILVRAVSKEEARERGQKFGEAAQMEYTNANGNRVLWVLRQVIDVTPILDKTIGDGCEIYYSFLDEEQVRCLYEAFRLDSSVADTSDRDAGSSAGHPDSQ
jgi:hypothetical protein